IEVPHMTHVVCDGAFPQPLAHPLQKEFILEILAPNGVVGDTHLGQGSIEIQHSNQSGPLPTPIGDGQNWTAMISQPREDMITILPDRYSHNQWRLWGDGFEHIHAHPLIPNKSMFQRL